MNDLISRKALLAEYDRVHIGPPGGARKLMEDAPAVREWIPVSERLPEDDSDVLAYLRIGEEGRIYPANYAKGMWFDCIFNTPATDTTTHWMPLPELPKEEEK